MANPDWGELLTATMVYRRKKIGDAVTKNNALIMELRRRGAVRTIDGGRSIATTLMMDDDTNFQWYLGREALNATEIEVLDTAEFPWKQYAHSVTMTGLTILKNSGKSQVYDMMAKKVDHAKKIIANKMHEAAHSDGTLGAGKAFAGLGLLVSETAGATVGGIDSSADIWWDNQRTATGEAAVSSATIVGHMARMRLKLTRGTDRVNLITADDDWYLAYEEALQGQQRFMSSRMAEAGFNHLMYSQAPVVADGGVGGFHPAGMRFLNLDTIELVFHKDRNNKVLEGPRRPIDEDSDTRIIAGMGNFLTSNRMLNGVITL